MVFSDLSALLDMGGHGLYVWSCYAITLLVIIFNIVVPLRMRKRFFKEQARQLRREEIHASDS